jgi:hypothetical protein
MAKVEGEAMDWKHLLAYITGTIDQGGCFTGVDAMGETLPQTRAMSHTINTCETPSGTVAKHTQSPNCCTAAGVSNNRSPFCPENRSGSCVQQTP